MTIGHVCCSSMVYERSVNRLLQQAEMRQNCIKHILECAECHSMSLKTLTIFIVKTCHHKLKLPQASSLMNAEQL